MSNTYLETDAAGMETTLSENYLPGGDCCAIFPYLESTPWHLYLVGCQKILETK